MPVMSNDPSSPIRKRTENFAGKLSEPVAGFVLDILGHIPTEGEHFDYGALKLEVTQMRNLKIESIKVTKTAAIESGTSVEPNSDPSRTNRSQ